MPVRSDPALAEALATLELDADVPEALWIAVAETLAWAYKLDAKAQDRGRRRLIGSRSDRNSARTKNELRNPQLLPITRAAWLFRPGMVPSMALRLSTSTFSQGPPSASELEAQARRCLATGDTAAYRKLFGRAAEHEDPQSALPRARRAARAGSERRRPRRCQASGRDLHGGGHKCHRGARAGAARAAVAQLRRRGVVRAVEPRCGQGAVLGRDSARPLTPARRQATSRRSSDEKRPRAGRQPHIRPMQAALAALARRAKRVAVAGAAGDRADAQPVHDRA